MKIKDSLFLKKQHHYERVAFDEILFLRADGNYSEIHTETENFLYATVLKNLKSELPPDKFFRVHRSYVINLHRIKGFERNILFIGGIRIPVSRAHREEVFKLFKTI